MTLDKLRIYYNTVVGAIGGLIGWALITLLLRFNTDTIAMLFIKDALLGALVGFCIGAAVGSAEQLAGSLTPKKALRAGRNSGFIGLIAGLIGLVVGEIVFLGAGGGVWPRAAGWALFGMLLGIGQGRVTGLPAKSLYGGLGGALGGLVGGATYERLSLMLLNAGIGREIALTLGGAIGLMILGACLGLFIGLVEDILRSAWIRFVYGPLEGQTRTLDASRKIILGKADRSDIVLGRDPDVALAHAHIEAQGGEYIIAEREGPVLLRQAGETRRVQRHMLRHNDTIQLGRTRFVFQTDEGGQ